MEVRNVWQDFHVREASERAFREAPQRFSPARRQHCLLGTALQNIPLRLFDASVERNRHEYYLYQ